MPLKVNPNNCPQNHPCPAIKVCPAGALSQEGFNAPKVNPDKCEECGLCTNFCAGGALTLE